MRDYELVVIISPEVSDEGVPQTLEKLEQMVTAKGGSVTSVDFAYGGIYHSYSVGPKRP